MRLCPACGWDNGYPNVRQALLEEPAVIERVNLAEAAASRRHCLDQLIEFRNQLMNSVAVIATSPSRAHALLSDDSEAFSSFYRVVQSGVRIPRGNWFDQVRGIADELLFPNYREFISFAALSLDGVGCWYYGSVHLVLADFAIRNRATAFEENSLLFCEKHQLGTHKSVPPGYRVVWNKRSALATAKLEPLFQSTTKLADMSGILLNRSHEFDADLIEIHIYDRINRHSVRKVIVKGGGSEDDIIIRQLIARDCTRAGIPFEEV